MENRRFSPLSISPGPIISFLRRLLAQVFADQDLEQLIPVDLADQSPGVVVVGDIGGVLGEDITHDLIDGIIALFLQCLIDGGEDLVDLRVLFHRDAEFPGKIVHTDTTFLSLTGLSNIELVYSIFEKL